MIGGNDVHRRRYPKYLRRSTGEQENRGRKAKPAPTNMRLRMAMPKELYQEFLEIERSMVTAYKRAFTRAERIIFFCKTVCGWSRDKIERTLDIPNSQFSAFNRKIKELMI